MNIYDFDDTIYDGDTNRDIILYGFDEKNSSTVNGTEKEGIP